MSGIFGIISEENCIDDAYWGTLYLQHRAQDYCGIAWKNGNDKLKNSTHKGLVEQNYKDKLGLIKTNLAIGCVSGSREPVSELSNTGGMMLCYDGNFANYSEIKDNLLKNGSSFSGYHNPEEIGEGVLISKIIARQSNFEKGIESLINHMQGDFSIITLTLDGIYAARGWGRKPLILGKKEGSYAVSSESISFINQGFNIVRDVEPGEVVLLNSDGINSIKKFDLSPIKYGTFEWIYTANPASVIDGICVELVRNYIGNSLAKKLTNLEVDVISPIPDSGRCHAFGVSDILSKKIGVTQREVFKKFSWLGRSFTPSELKEQKIKADKKLIPVEALIRDKNILLVDDSIVKGNQTRIQTKRLKELGAKKVYAAIACPPLISSCDYGKSIKKAEDCIAKRMSIDEIRETRGLDGLFYASIEDLEKAIGKPREQLCLECWGM